MIRDSKSKADSGLAENKKSLIAEAFNSIGIKGKISPEKHEWDFTAHSSGGSTEYIQFKKMMPVRHRQLIESIAYVQFIGSKKKIALDHIWLVLLLEATQESVINRVLEFCKMYDIKINILLLDTNEQIVWIRDGLLHMEKKFNYRVALLDDFKTFHYSKSNRRSSLAFSPNQQWILKHLLLNGIDEKFWGYKENKKLMVSTELEHATGIVQSACYETLKLLELQGYLIPASNGYKFRNIHNLIESWRLHLKSQRKMELYSIPFQPGLSEESWWYNAKQHFESQFNSLTSAYAIGGMAACAWYGLKVSSDFSVIFHLGTTQSTTVEKFRDLLRLTSSDEPTNIKLVLHKSYKPVVEILENRPTSDPYVDILQAAFDRWTFGGRGIEQSEKIFKKVLEPFWKQKGWSY